MWYLALLYQLFCHETSPTTCRYDTFSLLCDFYFFVCHILNLVPISCNIFCSPVRGCVMYSNSTLIRSGLTGRKRNVKHL